MYEHLSECRVSLPDSRYIIENVSRRVAELCVSIVDNGMEKILVFVDGEVIVRALDKGILMQVVATDVLSYYGIRTALEGIILELAASQEFTWRPGDLP
ncbi:SMa0974 family conjugal transfer regulator [Sinorhizobium alkalisoli]|uniref:Uncharacterized protein n=1 Tax=Sinorhizobium alkalisoli TaxID=1752398 RepID=A0A1E3V4Q4_9HYPH|nr:hypothetical protein [Sinorhizobium alkalisoli]ODR88407.1 hypothetical protein A8M32_25740 [Sinorhizobium alkalisoli]